MNRKTIIRELIGLLIIGLVLLGYHFYDTRQSARMDRATNFVAEMILYHLEQNQNAWPTGWDDMKDDYVACANKNAAPSFEELQKLAGVNWSASPTELAKDDHTAGTVSLIWGKSEDRGIPVRYHYPKPNQMILDCLRETEQPPSTSTAPASSTAYMEDALQISQSQTNDCETHIIPK